MNFITYTLRYLFVIGQVAYEENYWDQIIYNDLWAMTLTKINKH